MNTANEVKALARRLSNANGHLNACVGNGELLQVINQTRATLAKAEGMRSRSAQANEALAKAVQWATDAVEAADGRAIRKTIAAHLV